MNIGQAYLAIYDFPTTTLRGYWVPVLVLFFYYWVLSCCCFWTVANVRHKEVIESHFDLADMNFEIVLASSLRCKVQYRMNAKMVTSMCPQRSQMCK